MVMIEIKIIDVFIQNSYIVFTRVSSFIDFVTLKPGLGCPCVKTELAATEKSATDQSQL